MEELKRFEPGDLQALAAYRNRRVRNELASRDYGGILLFDPINIRYATGSSNMQVWTAHNQVRYALVLAGGPTIVFEFPGAAHLLSQPGVIVDEIREPIIFSHPFAGRDVQKRSRSWAAQITELLREHAGRNKRLAVDRVDPAGAFALLQQGLSIADGQEMMEAARAIKSTQEIELIRHSIEVAQAGVHAMRAVLVPGMSEQELWSHLHQRAIALGAEWFETRLLSSGPRTAPWYQQCGDRIIQEGDVIALDTDMIGPFGYCADFSRSWLCGERAPNDAQRRLYSAAHRILQRNLELLKPGLGFVEYAELCGDLPEQYRERRYCVLAHGVGMADEYPFLSYQCDLNETSIDGVFTEGMVVCVESYVARADGREGIKLEEQVVITASGTRNLSSFPYELQWL